MNPHIKTRLRVAGVGNMLVEGPFSIRPPIDVDDYGWLECELRLTHTLRGVVESAAVYVDDSMNREEGFLPPMIRYVRWDRGADLGRAVKGELSWPSAEIQLSHFEEHRPTVDAIIRDVQARLSALPFVVCGLSADRSVPDVEPDPRGIVTAFSRNGVQSAEFTSSSADGGLHEAVLAGIATLRGLLHPIALAGWRESYQTDLSSPAIGGSRWWDYQTPTSSEQAS